MSDMTTSTTVARGEAGVEDSAELTPGGRGFVITTLRSQPQAVVGLTVVVLFILVAIFAP